MEKIETDKAIEFRRRRRGEELKERIMKFQDMREQKRMMEIQQAKDEIERKKQRELTRKEYFEMQRKNIDDFRI